MVAASPIDTKTTYYLRSRAATHVERSTLRRPDSRLNAVTTCISELHACSVESPDREAWPRSSPIPSIKKEKSFFETRVIDYQTGSSLQR